MRREPYDPDFDETDGLTESPDVAQARGALVEAQTGANRTEEAIRASKLYIAQVVDIREKNHFTQKIRAIIQSQSQAPRSA